MLSAPPSERDTCMSPARRLRQRPRSAPPPALTPHPPLLAAPTWFTAGSCCKDASRLKETHRKQRKSSGRELPPLTHCPLEQLWDPKMGQAAATPAGSPAHAEHPTIPQTGTASGHAYQLNTPLHTDTLSVHRASSGASLVPAVFPRSECSRACRAQLCWQTVTHSTGSCAGCCLPAALLAVLAAPRDRCDQQTPRPSCKPDDG